MFNAFLWLERLGRVHLFSYQHLTDDLALDDWLLNASFESSNMAGKPEYCRYFSHWRCDLLFVFLSHLSHPKPSLSILGGLNFCVDRKGGGHYIEGVLTCRKL